MDILTERTLIARKLALGASAIVWIATYTAHVLLIWHVPAPGGDGVPGLYSDFHGWMLVMYGLRTGESWRRGEGGA